MLVSPRLRALSSRAADAILLPCFPLTRTCAGLQPTWSTPRSSPPSSTPSSSTGAGVKAGSRPGVPWAGYQNPPFFLPISHQKALSFDRFSTRPPFLSADFPSESPSRSAAHHAQHTHACPMSHNIRAEHTHCPT
eukprot:3898271-Rhodomonas_salina.1